MPQLTLQQLPGQPFLVLSHSYVYWKASFFFFYFFILSLKNMFFHYQIKSPSCPKNPSNILFLYQ